MSALLIAATGLPAAAQEIEASTGTTTAPVVSTGTVAPVFEAPSSTPTVFEPIVSSTAPAVESLEPFSVAAAVKRPWVLGEIAVIGNKNVKFGTIRSQVKARKGDLYDRPDLDRDVQSLLALGNFERVGADVTATGKKVPDHFKKISGSSTTVKLTFHVVERPLIKKLKIEGNKKLSKGLLLDAIGLKNKDPLDMVKVREDEAKILEKYREKGYLDATVESTVVKDTAALTSLLTFKVVEGPRSRIYWIDIAGVKALKLRKLLKEMKNRRKKVFFEKDLEDDMEKLRRYYMNRGYLDVQVATPTVRLSHDKTRFVIETSVEEGRSYRYGKTSFSGHLIYTSSELVKAVEYRENRVFSQERFEDTIRGIQELYAEKGRLRARVTPVKTFNPKTDRMDVHYNITEGDIVYIAFVDVEGYKATKKHVFKREVVIKSGQIFKASRIRKSREKIMNLGFVDDVDVDIQGTDDPDKVDVIFDVVEGKPGILTAGAAYSSLDGLIGTLSLQHLNLFGRAQRASVQWSFGRRVQDYSVSWTSPWLGNSPTSLGLDLFNTRRINPFEGSSSAYTERNRGGTIRLGPRFEEDKYHLNFAYTFSQVQLANVQDRFRGRILEGTSNYSSLSVELARDTRDNIWDPTRGSRNSIGLALTGGPLQGDIHLFKPTLNNAFHYHVFSIGDWPFVTTIANRAAYITQFYETKEVPVFNRFYIGGQDTLRGYSPSGEVGFPSGAKLFDVFNIEFGFPLARERRKTIVKFVVFFDMGGSWDRVKDFSARIGSGTRDIKTDAGFGIRFTTPAFPIRLDWGYGFNHRPGEKLYQINFGLGNLF